jgi:CarboxypepD_reg-like domain
MKYLIVLLTLTSFLLIRAQRTQVDTARMMQLSGVVIDEDRLEPLPYATVWNRSIRKGVIADYYGFFTLVSFPGDTLVFNFYGYESSTYVIPDTLFENRYSIVHMMQSDTLNMPEVVVHPWPSREEFARYFVEMKPYDDAMRRAQRELSNESLAFTAAKMSNDASLAYGYAQNQRLTKLYSNGQLPANNLFNPYAWAKLVQDWKAGKLSRQ